MNVNVSQLDHYDFQRPWTKSRGPLWVQVPTFGDILEQLFVLNYNLLEKKKNPMFWNST
jgi:hypothetical protein